MLLTNLALIRNRSLVNTVSMIQMMTKITDSSNRLAKKIRDPFLAWTLLISISLNPKTWMSSPQMISKLVLWRKRVLIFLRLGRSGTSSSTREFSNTLRMNRNSKTGFHQKASSISNRSILCWSSLIRHARLIWDWRAPTGSLTWEFQVTMITWFGKGRLITVLVILMGDRRIFPLVITPKTWKTASNSGGSWELAKKHFSNRLILETSFYARTKAST